MITKKISQSIKREKINHFTEDNSLFLFEFIYTDITLLLIMPKYLLSYLEINSSWGKIIPLIRKFASSEREIASSEREIASSEREIPSSEREIASSEREIASSEREIASSEREIASSEREIVSTEYKKSLSEHYVYYLFLYDRIFCIYNLSSCCYVNIYC